MKVIINMRDNSTVVINDLSRDEAIEVHSSISDGMYGGRKPYIRNNDKEITFRGDDILYVITAEDDYILNT